MALILLCDHICGPSYVGPYGHGKLKLIVGLKAGFKQDMYISDISILIML